MTICVALAALHGFRMFTLIGSIYMATSTQHTRTSYCITGRDLEILGEVLRWGQLTTRQIARWFFDSPRTATNRLSLLLSAGYLRRIPIPWVAPAILTATSKAARARPDLQLPAKPHAPGRLLHDLTVVEIAAWLLDQDQEATWITEREILRDELKEARDLDGRLLHGPSRRPDGVLVRANNQLEAVELELTPKRGRGQYTSKVRWYNFQEQYAKVRWFAPSARLRSRIMRVINQYAIPDYMNVSPLPLGLDYLPGIKHDIPSRHRTAPDPDFDGIEV
jgi:hypothetical protein